MTVSPFRRRPERSSLRTKRRRAPRLRANNAWASKNVKELAEISGMRRDGLYKTFGSGKKDPQLSRILCLFEGMDVRIVVKPLPARAKPPRPKLGRPRIVFKKPTAALKRTAGAEGLQNRIRQKGAGVIEPRLCSPVSTAARTLPRPLSLRK